MSGGWSRAALSSPANADTWMDRERSVIVVWAGAIVRRVRGVFVACLCVEGEWWQVVATLPSRKQLVGGYRVGTLSVEME